jgi:predicted transposase/invertase (TIGR01784 family)
MSERNDVLMPKRTRKTRDWDGTIKAWVNENSQDFVKWLKKGATFKRQLATELKKITDFDADGVMEIEYAGQDELMEIEFQSTAKENMGDRLMLYNDLATIQHQGLPVWSYLIYLRDVKNYPDNPYIKRMHDGTEIKRLYYTLIRLWEIESREIRAMGSDGLLPLIMLTRDGANLATFDELTEEMKAKKQSKLLSMTFSFATLSLQGHANQQELRRRSVMSEDLLKDSWFVQEWMNKGEEKGVKKGLEKGVMQTARELLLSMVQAHFPEHLPLAEKLAQRAKDPALLKAVTIKVIEAHDQQEVARLLEELASQTKLSK